MEQLSQHIPFGRVFSYCSLEEIKTLANTHWIPIVEYHDNDAIRGQIFGLDRWINGN